jgi:iron complex transport system permease protein
MQTKTNDLPKYNLRFLVLGGLFLIVFFGSFALGRYFVPPSQVGRIFLYTAVEQLRRIPMLQGLGNLTPTWSAADATVVINVRLPRVLAAVLVGAALATAGAAYQGMFQNPMVSPDILGASAGSGFGAALAIYLGASYALISTSAFICGLAAVLLAYMVSRVCRMDATLGMVLAGMMIGSLFSSGTSFIKLIADTDSQLPAITYWLMGSLTDIRQKNLLAAIPILAGLIPLYLLRWRINLLTTGEDEARSMGIHTGALRGIIIVCATLATAASVSISGMIGWVGLVIPHFCRMAFGYDYRRIIPAAMLMGSTFLLVVDDVARMISTTEVPLGILTSFIGAPVFVYLILTGGEHRER